jgi:hypothetical protein
MPRRDDAVVYMCICTLIMYVRMCTYECTYPSQHSSCSQTAHTQHTHTHTDSVRASVILMSGTSMATPTCAGAAAIVRQYFREGYHISGSKNVSAGINASAALMKAAMIHGGRPLRYMSWSGTWMSESKVGPTNAYGYGLLDLSSVLWFGKTESGFELATYDYVPVTHGQARTWCFDLLSNKTQFRASLVWTDPAGDPSADVVLVHNLDLTVVDAAGKFHYGNHLYSITGAHGKQPHRDVVNNAEQVTLTDFPPGLVTVLVSGTSIQSGYDQRFALVVTGDFARQNNTCGVPRCPNRCSGHGLCASSAICECYLPYHGPDCSLEIPKLPNNQAVNIRVSNGGWAYHRFTIHSVAAVVTINLGPGSNMIGSADADFYIDEGRPPSLGQFLYRWSPTLCSLLLATLSC